MGIWEMGSKKFWKKFWKIVPGVKCHQGVIGVSNAIRGYGGVKCHLGVFGRQMPPPIYCGVKGHPEVIGASKAIPRLLGRQRPGASKGPKSSRRQKSGASKGPLWVEAIKATRHQSSGSQNSGVRVHVVKGPGRQKRWIRFNLQLLILRLNKTIIWNLANWAGLFIFSWSLA